MPRVLVADDAAALRLVVRITLESQGWSVLEAADGGSAVARVTADRPDLLLLDLDLGPGSIDGIEVCRRVQDDPATAAIPVLILTASERPEDRARAAAAGAVGFLTKPFGPLQLLEAIRRTMHEYLSGPGLGLYLVDAGVLDPAGLERALAEQRRRAAAGRPEQLGAVLTGLGLVTAAELAAALDRQRADLDLRLDPAS
jgi:CheY-like chemotaxis protein